MRNQQKAPWDHGWYHVGSPSWPTSESPPTTRQGADKAGPRAHAAFCHAGEVLLFELPPVSRADLCNRRKFIINEAHDFRLQTWFYKKLSTLRHNCPKVIIVKTIGLFIINSSILGPQFSPISNEEFKWFLLSFAEQILSGQERTAAQEACIQVKLVCATIACDMGK